MVHSDDDLDGHELVQNLKVEGDDNYEPLRHTQYFHPIKRKENYMYEQKIKEL